MPFGELAVQIINGAFVRAPIERRDGCRDWFGRVLNAALVNPGAGGDSSCSRRSVSAALAAELLARFGFLRQSAREGICSPVPRARVYGFSTASVMELASSAGPGDDDDFGAMQKPVEQCGGQHAVVVEGFGPLFKLAVGGEDGRAAFVALGYDLEKTVGSLLIYGQIAQFVDLCGAPHKSTNGE